MLHLGDFPASHTAVCIPFGSYAASTGAPSATTNFAAGDIQIYKDGGTTQRSSSAGITVSTSFDSNTGLQMIVIDTSDNTDAGFYATGHEYQVAVADITVDGQTLRFWAGCFSIERAGGILALIKGNAIKVDVNTIKTQAVTCSAGVTVNPSVGTTANTTTHLNQIYDTDYATVYDTTNKAFLAKLGNFAMGGSSLALTTGAVSGTTLTFSGAVAFQSTFAVTTSTSLGALSCTTLTASGAVAFQSTFGVTGAVTFSSTFATTGTTTFNALTVTNATTLSGAVSMGSTFSTTGTVTFNAFTVTNALTVSGATTLTGAVTASNASNNIDGIDVAKLAGTAYASTTLFTLASHDPGATIGTSTLTQAQVTGGAYTVQSSSCVLGDARIANLDAAVSSRGTSTLTQTQVTGGAYSVQSASCVLGDARVAHLDADVSSRMATYTQPTGFLAATFPSAVSSLTQTQVSGGAYALNSASFAFNAALDFTTTQKTSLNAATPAVTVSDKTGFSLASGGLASVTAWTVAITGNITGNLSGSVGSVTGNVGGSVASVTAGVTVTTNNDKTGYALTQSFPTNFSALGITAAGKVSEVVLVDTTTTNSDMLTAAAVRDVSNSSPAAGSLGEAVRGADAKAADIQITLGAAGAGLTAIQLPSNGLANVTAWTVAIAGNITGNLSGSVGSVTGSVASVAGAVGSVTGNVGGNVTGSIGSLATQAKADVNAEADTALADAGVTTTVTGRIDAAITSRMATYTQPAGFLAATFPGTVASTTNITGGTITTVTNLTNAPTSGDFTAAMKTSLNAATPTVTLAAGAITDAAFTVPAAAAGRPTGILSMLRRVFEWTANKKTRNRSGGHKVLYGTDGTTVLETQVQSTTGTVDQETQGS